MLGCFTIRARLGPNISTQTLGEHKGPAPGTLNILSLFAFTKTFQQRKIVFGVEKRRSELKARNSVCGIGSNNIYERD